MAPGVRERAGKVELGLDPVYSVGYALSADGWPPITASERFPVDHHADLSAGIARGR
jgi:hypothetical protein